MGFLNGDKQVLVLTECLFFWAWVLSWEPISERCLVLYSDLAESLSLSGPRMVSRFPGSAGGFGPRCVPGRRPVPAPRGWGFRWARSTCRPRSGFWKVKVHRPHQGLLLSPSQPWGGAANCFPWVLPPSPCSLQELLTLM